MHLLLHIGPPKTGSTAIQKSLFQSRNKLTKAGILLFPRERDGLAQRVLATKHSLGGGFSKGTLRRKFDTMEAAQEWSAQYWRVLADEVEKSDADLCVISSEHFGYSIDVPALVTDFQALFSGITVLAYVRDPVSLYYSLLQQSLRGGAPLMRFRTPAKFKYRLREVLEQFQTALGPDNVVVRNFARDNLEGGDVAVDFFHQFDRFGKTVRTDPMRANESLPGAVLAFLMLMNETFVSGKKDQRQLSIVRKLANSEAVAALPAFKPQIPQAAAQIRANTADDCDWFNHTFLTGQVPLTADRSPVPTALSDAEWRALMRDELLGYLTPEALAVLGQDLIRLGVPE